MRWLLLVCGPLLGAAVPRFDPTALLREGLVPADAAAGAVIYRLRASDPTFDYPLVFSLAEQSSVVHVVSLNCSRFNSVCQANVVLKKMLDAGRFYDFSVIVRNQRGESARLNCSFLATNATTPTEKIFPGAPSLLTVSENARRNTELGVILARGSLEVARPVLLELWGSPEFGLHQKLVSEKDASGTIVLINPLDYETKTVHHLTVLANDPWTNKGEDTRNIAGWPLIIVVIDEQDTPPVFSIAPPTTTLSPNLIPSDLILRVHAEDGDRGNPRKIAYGLVSEGNPLAKFFKITEDTGELLLARPLSEILSASHTGQPILLTVTAEEIRSNPEEAPAQTSSVQLALIPPGITASEPTFGAIEYNALLNENSPAGTILDLPQAEVNTQPGDVVTLSLINNNGTFEISPNVVDGHSKFQITVHDPKLLDYEQRQSVQCYIIAKQLGAGNYSARAKLTVLLNDINDNPPVFKQKEFHGNVHEHAKIGTTVLVVEAGDVDREPGSKIKYIDLKGTGSDLFNLDQDTGLITVANSQDLDAEVYPTLKLTVIAADENGKGLTATSTVTINLLDINDQVPTFEKTVYEFILSSDLSSFTTPAFIKAIDRDISPPNNEIIYELKSPPDALRVDSKTGQVRISGTWNTNEVTIVRARASDEGVPILSSECEIRIYPPEGQSRKMDFILPGSNLDKEAVAQTLRALTGARVTIDRIRPYTGNEPGAAYVSKDDSVERSVVEATVTSSKNSVIDVNDIQKLLDKEIERNQYREKEIIRIQEGSSGSLLWLLILFFILMIIALIILILCCLFQQCPLYMYAHRKKTPKIEKIEKVKIIGSGQGRESKSVQVAEWFGRKEAWTPEHVMVDAEAESLRRHEVERGSDRGGARRTLHRQSQIHREPSRDQLYIREGNTDILRLITRGGEQQQQVPLVADHPYMVDSGKDILMRRFIDQQQAEAAKAQVLLPNAVNRLQTEHELLEASLRQQNALLRQILLDRERDLRLETQSLPAGTQTDQNAATQTEPQYLRPPQRKVRSDNDQSDGSDDELAAVKARAKRRNGQRIHIRRKIKTPIQEESELEIVEKPQKSSSTERGPKVKHTKTSELRQKRAASEARSSQSRSSKNGLRKEVLREISASLEQSDESGSERGGTYFRNGTHSNEAFSDDSLEISPRSEKTIDSSKYKYHSETDLRMVSPQSRRRSSVDRPIEKRSQSHTDLTKMKPKQSKSKRRGSRYMDWYTKDKEKRAKEKSKRAEEVAKSDKRSKEEAKAVDAKTLAASRILMDTEASARKKADSKKNVIGPEHPLLQHSEHRFEPQYPGPQNAATRRPEDDGDSGIALTKPAMAQKKSVFTIAYDDMHTSQLRPDSSTPP